MRMFILCASVFQTRDKMANYATCLASRGLMFSNSARARHNNGASSGLGFMPLHKPQWFDTCKQVRTVAGLLLRCCGITTHASVTSCIDNSYRTDFIQFSTGYSKSSSFSRPEQILQMPNSYSRVRYTTDQCLRSSHIFTPVRYCIIKKAVL